MEKPTLGLLVHKLNSTRCNKECNYIVECRLDVINGIKEHIKNITKPDRRTTLQNAFSNPDNISYFLIIYGYRLYFKEADIDGFKIYADNSLLFTLPENTDMKKDSILSEALEIVANKRSCDVYDTPEQSFKNIATIASILTGKELTSEDCCKIMIALKLVREGVNHKRDNLVDLAGYASLLNDIEEFKNK